MTRSCEVFRFPSRAFGRPSASPPPFRTLVQADEVHSAHCCLFDSACARLRGPAGHSAMVLAALFTGLGPDQVRLWLAFFQCRRRRDRCRNRPSKAPLEPTAARLTSPVQHGRSTPSFRHQHRTPRRAAPGNRAGFFAKTNRSIASSTRQRGSNAVEGEEHRLATRRGSAPLHHEQGDRRVCARARPRPPPRWSAPAPSAGKGLTRRSRP